MLQHTITSAPSLVVAQRVEMLEMISGFETANSYDILDMQGAPLGFVAEEDEGGFMAALTRQFLGSRRGFKAHAFEHGARSPFLTLSRDFSFFFSTMEVKNAQGHLLGTIHQKFGIINKKYELKDAQGQTFATISSPIWRLWTFPVTHAASGQDAGAISKKWSGGMQELFTDADTFHIDFGQANWAPEQRAVIFATAITIDFDHFENNSD